MTVSYKQYTLLYTLFVALYLICTFLLLVYVQFICIVYMYSLYVLFICTVYMYMHTRPKWGRTVANFTNL